MNNQQFRRLVLDTPVKQQDGSSKQQPAASSLAFGARSRPGALMTPRNVRGSVEANFARQLASRNASTKDTQKTFKSSAAPKGTKLAAGYHDRTQDRVDEDQDDRSRRIRALEEQLKLDQIDRDTFEALRDEITGGDIGATHLVKGLDRRLLERVRRGEDVMSDTPLQEEADQHKPVVDEDKELDALEAVDVAPVVREQVIKKGEMAPPLQVAGAKRKRDAILAELKAARKAAIDLAAAAPPILGSHFRKIGQEPRVEVDEKGREVLITVGEDGKVKRKVRKMRTDGDQSVRPPDLLEVDRKVKPMGIEGAELPTAPAPVSLPNDDDDIFEGVGATYDPLAGLGEEEEENGDDDDNRKERPEVAGKSDHAGDRGPQSGLALDKTRSRNYFDNYEPTASIFSKPDDATLMATLQRASAIASKPGGIGNGTGDVEEAEQLKRRAAMLENRDRDMDDLDMGFGSSRVDDGDDADDDGRIKLSQWKGAAGMDGDEDERNDRGGKQRKRGPKKKKGNKDSAADVLKVMERRQAN